MESTAKRRHSKNLKDYVILSLSLIGLILSSIPLLFEKEFNQFLEAKNHRSLQPKIGQIALAKNDIRNKQMGSYQWTKVIENQEVSLGDSIFTGPESLSRVTISSGGELEIGENSMVTFRVIDDLQVANLDMGSLFVAVNGSLKIAILGELAEFEGNNSKIQISINRNKKAEVKLIQGEAKVKINLSVNDLKPNSSLTVIEQTEPLFKTNSVAEVIPAANPKEFVRIFEFLDFYDRIENKYKMKSEFSSIYKYPIQISWSIKGDSERVYGQLSRSSDFKMISDSFTQKAAKKSDYFYSIFQGDNFYRLSSDGIHWSQPISFVLESSYLKLSPPQLIFPDENKFYLLGESVQLDAKINKDAAIKATIIETSATPEFHPNTTDVHWVTSGKISMHLNKSQSIYFRTRGVSANYQVTEISAPIKVDIERPALPLAPLSLKLSKSKYVEGENISLVWQRASRASKYEITYLDQFGNILAKKVSAKTFDRTKTIPPGAYKVTVASIDRFGRKSTDSMMGSFNIEKKIPLFVAEQKNPPQDRKPATPEEPLISQKSAAKVPEYLSPISPTQELSILGAAYNMVSRETLARGKTNPTAILVGIQWKKWKGSIGLEAILKSKFSDLSSDEVTSVSPIQAEARIHKRWSMDWNPFDPLARSQMSLFAGYEYYRNSAAEFFAPKYDLIKSGLALEFPAFQKWKTGGEFVYGFGLDQNKKYEISGHVGYYLKRNWSMGVGYRIHLFEAGSAASTPAGLSYKEGFGEGYSVLKWLY
jgi:hypothetical protein